MEKLNNNPINYKDDSYRNYKKNKKKKHTEIFTISQRHQIK